MHNMKRIILTNYWWPYYRCNALKQQKQTKSVCQLLKSWNKHISEFIIKTVLRCIQNGYLADPQEQLMWALRKPRRLLQKWHNKLIVWRSRSKSCSNKDLKKLNAYFNYNFYPMWTQWTLQLYWYYPYLSHKQ